MNKYNILKHPCNKIAAIKQGWSWPAFFFGLIWLLVKKLWAIVGVMIAIIIVMVVILIAGDGNSGAEALTNIISLIIWIVCGVNGNSWLENDLIKRGYDVLDTVDAKNAESAMAIYLKK